MRARISLKCDAELHELLALRVAGSTLIERQRRGLSERIREKRKNGDAAQMRWKDGEFHLDSYERDR